ncbi:hypothetical protein B0T11DRAFT_329520 [Plectosphaerella cucumerina]|uniref:Uncharacterized protein n=1 Tax=Plectosphaerella cucumerina TaxID=40658 RepID=A0A8K0TFH6_9PEZI|nr:hypothetical protein B0T11DRAFT_329520 [Plectosphaerella cucumerina]
MNTDEGQVDTSTPRSDVADEASSDEVRRTLYKVSCMILDVYNAVGRNERPPCRCREYRQRLQVAEQKLRGTLEVNRALSMENETLRVKVVQQRRSPAERAARGEHEDLYRRMEEIETNFNHIATTSSPTSPPAPPPPPKEEHVVRRMRSEPENRADGKLSWRDRVKVLFEPGEM